MMLTRQYSLLRMVAAMYYAKARDLHYEPEYRQLFLEEARSYERQSIVILKEIMALK